MPATVFGYLIYINIHVVRDSLQCRAPEYPPCAGHVISRPCALRSWFVVCVKAESLFFDSPFSTFSMLTS